MRQQMAYDIMFRFLDDRYHRLPSEDLARLLSDLQRHLFADGLPADPAVVAEWESAVRAVEAAQQPAFGKAS